MGKVELVMVDFSIYMNKPECQIDVGDICTRTDYLICDTHYKVISVEEVDGKLYAECEYEDEFTGNLERERIYVYYLEKVKEVK